MTDITKNKKQDTESLILRAAEEEFIAKGYDGARTTTIAEKAGVSHAMLHYYFRTKNKLFEQIVSEKMHGVTAILSKAIGNPNLPILDRVRNGVADHFDYLLHNRSLPTFILSRIGNDPTIVNQIYLKMVSQVLGTLQGLQQQIDEAADAGICRRVDAFNLLIDIVSLNLFPFIAAPILQQFSGNDEEVFEAFLKTRLSENIDTILHKLTPES